MNRRELLRRIAVGVAAASVSGSRRLSAQPRSAPRDSTAGDPLFRPDAVQERAVATPLDNDPVVKGIEQQLKCTCGCNLDIYVCRTTDFTCQYSPALHQEVLELTGAGKTPEQVVAAFVDKYGEQILMAPPPEGFNLAGYLVPGVAVLTAGAALAWLLLRRSRALAQAPIPATGPSPDSSPAVPLTSAEQDRLQRALDDVQD